MTIKELRMNFALTAEQIEMYNMAKKFSEKEMIPYAIGKMCGSSFMQIIQ